MINDKYTLKYLPLFYTDLEEAVDYISEVLNNKKAAVKLIDLVEKAILKRQNAPESFEPYKSLKERENPYYYIMVKNFMIFYVVLDENTNKVMEIRRFIYSKRNIEDLL